MCVCRLASKTLCMLMAVFPNGGMTSFLLKHNSWLSFTDWFCRLVLFDDLFCWHMSWCLSLSCNGGSVHESIL